MKRIFSLILALCSLTAMGQYPVSSINITLPAQPMPNTGDWPMPFVITAQARLVQGQVPGNLVESRILVTIKKGSSKVCGSYTQQNAPYSSFNSPTKTWSGGVAIGLLGSNCVLQPGTYELCVQFFSSNAPVMPLSNEVCKTFIIPETQHVNYSRPQNILPFDGKVFTDQESMLPINFRWTPVIPKPKSDVIYHIKIVEAMPGQSKTQAMLNTPIEQKDLTNETQTSFRLGKRNNGLFWEVEAQSGERIQGGPPVNYGKSDATGLSFKSNSEQNPTTINRELTLLQPADGTVIKAVDARKPVGYIFSVNPKPNLQEGISYVQKIWEVPAGMKAAQIIQSGQPPFFEKKCPPLCCVGYPVTLPPGSEGKHFVWTIVEVKEGPEQGQEVKQGKLLFNEFSVEKPTEKMVLACSQFIQEDSKTVSANAMTINYNIFAPQVKITKINATIAHIEVLDQSCIDCNGYSGAFGKINNAIIPNGAGSIINPIEYEWKSSDPTGTAFGVSMNFPIIISVPPSSCRKYKVVVRFDIVKDNCKACSCYVVTTTN